MKPNLFTILILGLTLLSHSIKSQITEHKLTVEIDNSSQYRYDAAYNNAVANQYNKEIAENIKNSADRYFTTLRLAADFINDKKINSKEIENEIDRLKVFGQDILDLLPLLNNDELTANKVGYTLEKAKGELEYSITNKNGRLSRIIKKNIMTQQFNMMTDDLLISSINHETGKSKESIKALCENSTDLHKCLVETLVNIKN